MQFLTMGDNHQALIYRYNNVIIKCVVVVVVCVCVCGGGGGGSTIYFSSRWDGDQKSKFGIDGGGGGAVKICQVWNSSNCLPPGW